ncbi:MAG TPA: hypothetical protein PKE27_22510 [Povalibacter sp.]|uniref:hypothetical protein n=1 Tax=Povalibacter sp. TaxID=1962978 RepID=UPI002B6A6CF8|nr:hypothetical protein [Povalibacter sp.]HMN47365.1 hypothetical protein [Povalibacter sp.]
MTVARLVLASLCLYMGACGLWNSGIEWRGGPYILIWIDDPSTPRLGYDLGEGTSVGRIDETVFAVGWDGRYVVAKQHPDGNKNVTNYFFIDSNNDQPHSDPGAVVVGPLNESEFSNKARELGLPAFSKTLRSLQ